LVNLISEIGLNHFGNVSLAAEYIDVLSKTKVNGISFQVREPEFYKRPEKKNLSLTEEDYVLLRSLVQKCGKEFGVAIADFNKIDFFESLNTDFYKIIRNDMTNNLLVDKLMKTGKKIIVSTGLSSEEDIAKFLKRYVGNTNFVMNHTQLSYEEGDCNLKAIETLSEKYSTPVSFGSHCSNHNVLYMSLCFSPTDILFYVKKDNKKKYPDDKHAVTLNKVKEITHNLKILSTAVGSGNKIKLKNKITGMKI
jgi:sialic acid synthase SpsE